MTEPVPGLPEDVIGFKAKGKITDDDYKSVLIPAVEEEFARRGKVRLLYHIGDDCEGFEAAAMWDDTKLGMKHFSGWEKMALVTDIEWIRAALKIFGLAMPGHVKVFHNNEMDDAVRWASE